MTPITTHEPLKLRILRDLAAHGPSFVSTIATRTGAAHSAVQTVLWRLEGSGDARRVREQHSIPSGLGTVRMQVNTWSITADGRALLADMAVTR